MKKGKVIFGPFPQFCGEHEVEFEEREKDWRIKWVKIVRKKKILWKKDEEMKIHLSEIEIENEEEEVCSE